MRRVVAPVVLSVVMALSACQQGEPQEFAAGVAARELQSQLDVICDELGTQSAAGRPGTDEYERMAANTGLQPQALRDRLDEKCPGKYQAAALAEDARQKREAADAEARKKARASAPASGHVAVTPSQAAVAVEPERPSRAELEARLEQVANVLGYGPVQDAQGFAYVMLTEVCQPVASGAKTWADIIEEDEANGAPGESAQRMVNFLRTEFCPSY